ncbi:MAG: hypothetical protein RL722_1239 [Pseudomonadota bacterium]
MAIDPPPGGRNAHYCVLNLKGTSKNSCGCASWLRHWRNYAKTRRIYCAEFRCNRRAEVGAHVLIDDWRSSFSWWIVPLCKSHNHYRNTKEMYLDRSVTLVSANVALTCGRSNEWSAGDADA